MLSCLFLYFKKCEVGVLSLLKWDVATVTPHDFLPHILHRLPLDANQSKMAQRHAQTFIALCFASGEI